MKIKIVRAQISDCSEILKYVEKLVSELAGQHYSVDEDEVLPFAEKAMADGTYIVLLAKNEENNTVAILTLGETGAIYASGKFGIIHELYVEPDLRSQGIGKQLLEHAKKVSKEYGWKRIEVGAPSYPEWQRTKEFYLREGFAEIGPRLGWKS